MRYKTIMTLTLISILLLAGIFTFIQENRDLEGENKIYNFSIPNEADIRYYENITIIKDGYIVEKSNRVLRYECSNNLSNCELKGNWTFKDNIETIYDFENGR